MSTRRVGSKVRTPDGAGIIIKIQNIGNIKRFGIILNIYPTRFSPKLKEDQGGIVYYFSKDVEVIR